MIGKQNKISNYFIKTFIKTIKTNDKEYVCSTCSTMFLVFVESFFYDYYHLFAARYLRRVLVPWCAKCANEITIRGPYRRGNVIYISHYDMERIRKKIFHNCAFYGRAYSYSSRVKGSGWKMRWKRCCFSYILWYHTALYKGNDIRRMFLDVHEGFNFSVGNM